jgi:hypothetical protein
MARLPSSERAQQLALAHLHLSAARAPGEPGEGAVIALRRAKGGGAWIAQVWTDTPAKGQGPAHRLRIESSGVVTEEPVDPAERHRQRRRTGGPRGRPRVHAEGERAERITFTPDGEDLLEIQRRAVALEVPESEIVRRLVRQALGRAPTAAELPVAVPLTPPELQRVFDAVAALGYPSTESWLRRILLRAVADVLGPEEGAGEE